MKIFEAVVFGTNECCISSISIWNALGDRIYSDHDQNAQEDDRYDRSERFQVGCSHLAFVDVKLVLNLKGVHAYIPL